MLHIALAKGRIAKTVMKRLAEGGFHFSDYSDESRKLIFTDDEERIRVTLVKSPDVAVYVRRGAADAGIVGKDVLMEDGEEDVYEVLDLGIGRCRMAVSGIKGNQKVMQKRILTVASKYPVHRAKIFRRSLPAHRYHQAEWLGRAGTARRSLGCHRRYRGNGDDALREWP